MGIFEAIDGLINSLLSLLGSWGAVLGSVFILFESIIPILPLSVFITLNFMTFGSIWGFVISWLFTVLGCMLSFWIFKNGVSERLYNRFKNIKKLNNFMDLMANMKFSTLVTVIAMPFTPAFLINIAAGIARIDTKKYLYALMIGKISLVYFWGYIGVSLIDSLKNPMILIKIVVILVIMYFVSLVVNKKFNLK
jgi:uncharacterized membrane protein YdjX (TVP38/TMEM64 family)